MSLKLFEKSMPGWFRGMEKVYQEKILTEKNDMATKKKKTPSKSAMEFLEEKLKYEILLYDWIVDRFWKHLKMLRIQK